MSSLHPHPQSFSQTDEIPEAPPPYYQQLRPAVTVASSPPSAYRGLSTADYARSLDRNSANAARSNLGNNEANSRENSLLGPRILSVNQVDEADRALKLLGEKSQKTQNAGPKNKERTGSHEQHKTITRSRLLRPFFRSASYHPPPVGTPEERLQLQGDFKRQPSLLEFGFAKGVLSGEGTASLSTIKKSFFGRRKEKGHCKSPDRDRLDCKDQDSHANNESPPPSLPTPTLLSPINSRFSSPQTLVPQFQSSSHYPLAAPSLPRKLLSKPSSAPLLRTGSEKIPGSKDPSALSGHSRPGPLISPPSTTFSLPLTSTDGSIYSQSSAPYSLIGHSRDTSSSSGFTTGSVFTATGSMLTAGTSFYGQSPISTHFPPFSGPKQVADGNAEPGQIHHPAKTLRTRRSHDVNLKGDHKQLHPSNHRHPSLPQLPSLSTGSELPCEPPIISQSPSPPFLDNNKKNALLFDDNASKMAGPPQRRLREQELGLLAVYEYLELTPNERDQRSLGLDMVARKRGRRSGLVDPEIGRELPCESDSSEDEDIDDEGINNIQDESLMNLESGPSCACPLRSSNREAASVIIMEAEPLENNGGGGDEREGEKGSFSGLTATPYQGRMRKRSDSILSYYPSSRQSSTLSIWTATTHGTIQSQPSSPQVAATQLPEGPPTTLLVSRNISDFPHQSLTSNSSALSFELGSESLVASPTLPRSSSYLSRNNQRKRSASTPALIGNIQNSSGKASSKISVLTRKGAKEFPLPPVRDR